LTLLFVAVLALAGAGLVPLLAAVPAATALTLALVARLVREHVPLRISFDWQIWRELFTETLPYAIALSIAAIYFYVTVIMMALGASFIIPLIAGSKGHAAIGVLRVQALVFIVSFISTASALALVSLRRYRALVISSTGALLLNIVLALVLIPAAGARGGALA